MSALKKTLLALPLLASAAAAGRCVVPSSNGKSDDSATIQAVFNRCNKDSTIVFEPGVDYNVFAPITANLDNVEISMQGTLHLPQDIKGMQQLVENAGGDLNWFTISGTDVSYIGSSDINMGWIKSYGQAWWDANPAGGTGAPNRPHLMNFNVDNGVMKWYKSDKPIAWGTSLNGNNVHVSYAFVDAISETSAFPFNTDGFDVGASNVVIEDSTVYNGDDSIAVQNGAHNVTFRRNTIGYQTHGMSIGSLGENQAEYTNVSNIHFEDNTVAGGLYAARFKSWAGGQGLVQDISWKNIRFFNVSFPIFVTQSYTDQNQNTAPRIDNSSVEMVNFSWENFVGSINSYQPGDDSCASDPCWYNVGLPDLKHTESIILECNTATSCKDFEFKNIQVYPDNSKDTTVICMKANANLNPLLGFSCHNGTFVPTEV